MHFSNVRELKDHTSGILRRVQREDVVVTVRGKPKAVIHKLNEADLEDYLFYQAKSLQREIESRWARYRRDRKVVPLEKMGQKLGRK